MAVSSTSTVAIFPIIWYTCEFFSIRWLKQCFYITLLQTNPFRICIFLINTFTQCHDSYLYVYTFIWLTVSTQNLHDRLHILWNYSLSASEVMGVKLLCGASSSTQLGQISTCSGWTGPLMGTKLWWTKRVRNLFPLHKFLMVYHYFLLNEFC